MPATAIDRIFERRLATLVNGGGAPLLRGGLRGVEKESLRVTPDGHVAMTPHRRRARVGADERAVHDRLLGKAPSSS